jgi:hypothetical protein
MSSSPPGKFCKTASCPSSEKLLNYRRQKLPDGEGTVIKIHLRGCDFCNAELELLKRYRLSDGRSYRLAEMPVGFRRLVEDLFRNTARGFLSEATVSTTRRWSN